MSQDFVLEHPTRPTTEFGRLFSRPLPRLLLVEGAVGLIAVTIDLTRGPTASALPARNELGSLPIYQWDTKNLVDRDAPLEPGASIAAYDTSAGDSVAKAAAPAAKGPSDSYTLEPGASVAAYGM
jgi:hypothetical protein